VAPAARRLPGCARAPTLRALRLLPRAPPASGLPSARRHATWKRLVDIAAPSRADAATAAVLAALPSGAKPCLRLCCRAGRAAVDAHARRLELKHCQTVVSRAAAARMPLLQELNASAYGDANTLGVASGLLVLAGGPAQLRNATVFARGGGAALGNLVSAVRCLTALTRLSLSVHPDGTQRVAQPLVLPWADIEVGAAAAEGKSRRGRVV
jgi:hypothetical protein